jgi:predicted ATPase
MFFLGHLADAAEQLKRGIALEGAVENLGEHRAQAWLYGEHPGVFCRVYLAWALWLLGAPDQALEIMNAAVDLGRRLAQPRNTAVPLHFAAGLHGLRGEFDAARTRSEAAIALAREHHLPQVLGSGTLCRGFALVGLGQQAEGMAELRAGLAAWNGVGAHLQETQWLGVIAEAHVKARQFDDALTALDRASQIATQSGECHYQAELHRLRGIALAETGEQAEATTWLQLAIDIARSQQAKSWELRAATSLARLWRDQRERAQAYDLLAPVYDWFTEGFDTADLMDAKTLLDQLA